MSDIKKAVGESNGFRDLLRNLQINAGFQYTPLVCGGVYVNRKNRINKRKSFDFSELTTSTAYGHNKGVGGIRQQQAKFWDSHPLTRRQHRHYLHGGFFSSTVECEYGFMPGVRVLQEEEIPNKRVVFRVSHVSARQVCLTHKTKLGAVDMTAINHPMGNYAHSALVHPSSVSNAPIRRTPKPAKSPRITYQANPNGLIFYRNKYPVAWLCAGHHRVQPPNQAKTVQFIDVAYYRVTECGANMETAFFDTMPQAIDFVMDALKAEGGAE